MTKEEAIARFACETEFDALPTEVVETVKLDILDTLGTALAGSAAPASKEVFDLLRGWGGTPESNILVFGAACPAHHAAFVNGTMAHALDYDDTHDRAVLHAGVSTVPAALAVADQRGGVNGKEFITAVALGLEMTCRLGIATTPWIGWMLTPLYGYFGAAAAAGKLLRLEPGRLLDAWGIAYSQSAGNTECVANGALTKRLQAGLAAQGGVLAAYLSRSGITGARQFLEGKAGIFQLYQRGEYDPSALVEGLGEKFELVDLSFKPYPCCRWLHTSIDAALELVREHRLSGQDIETVTVGVSRTAMESVGQPAALKRAPTNVVDAQFSIHYSVASALVRGRVGIDDFTNAGIRDADILRMCAKTTVKVDDEIDAQSGREISGAKLELLLNDGRKLSRTVKTALGDPSCPMSREQLIAKFSDCNGHSARPLSAPALDAVIEAVLNLEQITDVREISLALSNR